MSDWQAGHECLATGVDWVRWSASLLQRQGVYFGHGTDNSWDEALALVLHVLALPHDVSPLALQGRLVAAEKAQLLRLLQRRIDQRVPLPYLTQQAWFCGLPFQVNEQVLIPRSPIAELIEQGFSPWVEPDQVGRILDLCTGSGCIALACAAHWPDAEVVATDLSAEALSMAEQNAEQLQLEVSWLQGDLWAQAQGPFDIIVSNPPYVDQADLDAMPPEYQHEPRMALAAGEDGLDLVRPLLAQAADYLSEQGILVVEVGNSWLALEAAYPGVPFTWVEFQRGGDGVFVLDQATLRAHQAQLTAVARNAQQP